MGSMDAVVASEKSQCHRHCRTSEAQDGRHRHRRRSRHLDRRADLDVAEERSRKRCHQEPQQRTQIDDQLRDFKRVEQLPGEEPKVTHQPPHRP